MGRKVIQLAGKTLVVSIPSTWVKKQGIRKGDELDVQEGRFKLLITSKKIQKKQSSVSIDIDGFDSALIWYHIISLYRYGVKEIRIDFTNEFVYDVRKGKRVKTIDLLSQISDRLLGLSVISRSKNGCVIRELTEVNKEEFFNVFRKTFLSLIIYSEDVLNAIKTKDFSTLENLHTHGDDQINKLTDYSLRILNTSQIENYHEYYEIILLIEELGDTYSRICEQICNERIKLDKVLQFLEKTHKALRLFCNNQFDPKKKVLLEIADIRSEVKKKFEKKEELDGIERSVVEKLLVCFKKMIEFGAFQMVIQHMDIEHL